MKKMGFLILILSLLSSRLSLASSFEFVGTEKKSELIQLFNSARSPEKSELRKTWNCEMYGMRSSLQVNRGVTLYSFTSSGEAFKNSGAMPVPEYAIMASALVGKNKTLNDEIKITSSGNLVSRLSSTEPTHEVIAYSVCK